MECAVSGVQGKAQRRGMVFHSKELQRSHVPQEMHNPPRSELTIKVKVKCCKRCLWIIAINQKMSGQLLDLGSTARQVIVQWQFFNSGSDRSGLQEMKIPCVYLKPP
jgi:hypothetical protein